MATLRAMRILVTGSRGKVGSATVDALHQAGHDVTACDIGAPVFEAAGPDVPRYQQADLTDAGDAFAVVRGHDAVIHAAALPEPRPQPAPPRLPEQPDERLQHARGRGPLGRPPLRQRVERDGPRVLLPRAPVPARLRAGRRGPPDPPAGPDATAKYFSELLCDAASGRSDIRCITIRPSWVQWEGNYAHNLGAALRDPFAQTKRLAVGLTSTSTTSPYALRLAAESRPRHPRGLYIASLRHLGNRPLAELIRHHHGDEIELLRARPPGAPGPSASRSPGAC